MSTHAENLKAAENRLLEITGKVAQADAHFRACDDNYRKASNIRTDALNSLNNAQREHHEASKAFKELTHPDSDWFTKDKREA